MHKAHTSGMYLGPAVLNASITMLTWSQCHSLSGVMFTIIPPLSHHCTVKLRPMEMLLVLQILGENQSLEHIEILT